MKKISEWRRQLASDKSLYVQAKEMKKRGIMQRTGTKRVKGKDKPLYAVEYYGTKYRESEVGLKRALKRR